jgi:hypothetical protein
LVVGSDPSGWAVEKEPHIGIWVTPIDGWGFSETMDGNLASRFEVRISETGVDVGGGIRGWRGLVVSSHHKYASCYIEMTPRHVDWSGYVVLWVSNGDGMIFSGMAETTGLSCDFR